MQSVLTHTHTCMYTSLVYDQSLITGVHVHSFCVILSSLSLFLSCFQKRPCPEESATFLSRITWWWLNGYKYLTTTISLKLLDPVNHYHKFVTHPNVILVPLLPPCSLIWRGWRVALEYKDLSDLNREDKSGVVARNFQRNWDAEVRRTR